MADDGRSPYRATLQQHHITGKTLLCAAISGVAIAVPLFAMMGLTLLGSATLLLLASPLLLLFGPLLLFAASVFVLALVGFGAAGGMAFAGLWALRWAVSFLQEQGVIPPSAEAFKVGWKKRSPSEMLELDGGRYLEDESKLQPSENGIVETK